MKRKNTPYLFAALSAMVGFACGSFYFATPFVRFSFLLVAVLFISYFYASLERFGFYDDFAGGEDGIEIEEGETDDEITENETDETEKSDKDTQE